MSGPNELSFNLGARNAFNEPDIDFTKLEKVIIISEVSPLYGQRFIIPQVIEDLGGIDKVPRNSYIGKRITKNGFQEKQVLLFPFFSSHLSLPLKPGETAWAIFDRQIKQQGFWLTRCHSNEDGEDLNFSHYDRRYSKRTNVKGIIDTEIRNIPEYRIQDGYQNYSLTKDELNMIRAASNSLKLHEPVPRYTRRAGDFVINGSNNSMICLGTDRYWTKEQDPTESMTNVTGSIAPFSGVIDIVAGRSRALTYGKSFRTSANTIKNSDGNIEIAKGVAVGKNGLSEGDPDFYFDASRIYVSMNTAVDQALSLAEYEPILPTESELRNGSVGAAAFVKSDHIRIVSRKYQDDDLTVNGTIKIIKEGALSGDGADGSSIIMHSDGNIQIASSQKIFLGLGKENGGTDPETDGKGISQPYIKYQELKTLLDKFIKKVEDLELSYNNHIHNLDEQTVTILNGAAGLLATPYTPPQLGPTISKTSEETELRLNDDVRNTIETIKSSRIFGE